MKRHLSGGLLFLGCLAVLAAALVPVAAWHLTPPRPLGVLILDKTVPDTSYRGHRAFVWLLNHLRLVHPGSLAPYAAASDYVGFLPLTNRAWSVRPFPKVLGPVRVVYVASTYGVSAADLGDRSAGSEGRMLFGGMSDVDMERLERAARAGVTLIGEFNMPAEPMSDSVRARAERLFGFTWSGWTGRRSSDLSADVPPGTVAVWRRHSGQEWAFSGPGFVLVHRDGRVIVLEERHLAGSGLEIVPTTAGDSAGILAAPSPGGWFDLVQSAGSVVLAEYRWRVTPSGDSALGAAGIPKVAAAVLASRAGAARTFFLAGDFANISCLPPWSALRWGAALQRVLPVWLLRPQEGFFWRGYVPLVTSILDWASGDSRR